MNNANKALIQSFVKTSFPSLDIAHLNGATVETIIQLAETYAYLCFYYYLDRPTFLKQQSHLISLRRPACLYQDIGNVLDSNDPQSLLALNADPAMTALNVKQEILAYLEETIGNAITLRI